MLYKFNKIKWSHLTILTINNITDNELSCDDFKIWKLVEVVIFHIFAFFYDSIYSIFFGIKFHLI